MMMFHSLLRDMKPARSVRNILASASMLTRRPAPSFLFHNVPAQLKTARVLSTPPQLPSNLKLADPSILEPEESPEISLDHFSFPLLDVPESIVINSFAKPGEVTGPIKLERKIFEVAIRKDIILQAIRYTRNKRRQPKKTKRMSEIRGSNKKPRPQKGTGQSQVGHRRNSAWRGGQKAHGPVIRDYSIHLNKKVRALALMMALAAKFREGNLFVFDSLSTSTHRTKDLVQLLDQHGLADSLTLFVDYPIADSFNLAVRNLPKAVAMKLEHLNTYELVKKEKLAISSKAFKALQERLLRQYTNHGKQQAMQSSMEEYMKVVEQGKTLLTSSSS